MKKNIAIIAGGYSSEWAVSLKSAAGIKSFMDNSLYNSTIVTILGNEWKATCENGEEYPIDKNDFSFTDAQGQKTTFDFAYITIHGTPGENGMLQGYLEMLNIPYSCCGVLPAALSFNKFTCNHYLRAFGIKVADSILLREGQSVSDETVVKEIGLPCFIKSNVGGSSFGVTKVKTAEQIQPAIQKAFEEGNEVIVEALLTGTEITCGAYKTKDKTVAFPITEVVTANEFFDYDAKYNGQVQEITPARISDQLAERVKKLTLAIYDILGCKGIIRVDYIISEGEVINMLEVNTTPGMTPTSFIPQQVRAAGLEMKDVLTDIIENEFSR